jgi:hypothetical protein
MPYRLGATALPTLPTPLKNNNYLIVAWSMWDPLTSVSRSGGVFHFWVTDRHSLLRNLRHRPPRELVVAADCSATHTKSEAGGALRYVFELHAFLKYSA